MGAPRHALTRRPAPTAAEPHGSAGQGAPRRDQRVDRGTRLTGECDYQLQLTVADPPELEAVIDRLKLDFGVAAVSSRLVLREVPVDTTSLLAG